jgi:hypothetical protein
LPSGPCSGSSTNRYNRPPDGSDLPIPSSSGSVDLQILPLFMNVSDVMTLTAGKPAVWSAESR